MPASAESNRVGELHFSKEGPMPVAELIVPHGTKLNDLLKVQELISREVLPEISPRGCLPCISGCHLIIRERLENVLQVDLDAVRIIR
jgi:hypothetical protein